MKGIYSMGMMTKKKSTVRSVKFEYNNDKASSVFLAGDFNAWNQKKDELEEIDYGAYRKTLMLPPGTYEYHFLVDGKWEMDPLNKVTSVNCYETMHNVIHVR
jgi:1,4-alpha-glucan branching enzyme